MLRAVVESFFFLLFLQLSGESVVAFTRNVGTFQDRQLLQERRARIRMFESKSTKSRDGLSRDGDFSLEMAQLEKKVEVSARERMDLQALATVPSEYEDDDMGFFEEISNPLKVGIAAGGLSFLASYYVLHSFVFAGGCFLAAVLFATWDPMEEQSAAGAFTRVLGRGVIRASTKASPRISAVASAAVKGNQEVIELKERIAELETELAIQEEENVELRRILEMRRSIDRNLSRYSLEELKRLALRNTVPSSGTKSQLLMRLVKKGVIKL